MFQHFLAVKSPLRQAELHKQIYAKCEAGAESQGGRDAGKSRKIWAEIEALTPPVRSSWGSHQA